MKEIDFKVLYKVYPVSDFLKKKKTIKLEVVLCTYCNAADETLENKFLSCPVSKNFWFKKTG